MKKFRYDACLFLYAENIDRAFALLAYHFAALAAGQEPDPVFTGEQGIVPVKDHD